MAGPHPAASPGIVLSSSTSLVAALFLVSLALRPQIAAIGPLVPGIVAEFGAAYAFVGLLTTIPVLCMGLFALVGPSVAAWFGTRVGIALSVSILVASGVLRALAPDASLVLVATFGIGVGTAIIGPILAMFVRDRMPSRMVGGTSSYAGGTIVGAALGAALAVPLAQAAGGWRGSLLVMSVASGLSVAAWLLLVRRRARAMPWPDGGAASGTPEKGGGGDATSAVAPARRARRLELPRLPVRRPVVWAIGLLFALQSWLYYGTTAWLASVYIERGWDPGAAAVLLSLVSVASLTAIVIVPAGARRGITRRAMLTAAAAASTAGLAGVAILPDPAILWAALLGAGLGMTFTLLLTLPTDISDDPREVGGASALMLLVGYLLAAVAPFALGAARDATGDFAATIWVLVAIGALMMPLSWSLNPHRLRQHRSPAGAAA